MLAQPPFNHSAQGSSREKKLVVYTRLRNVVVKTFRAHENDNKPVL